MVWSRITIEGDRLKAVNLPFYKNRLTELSKELYLEHGWTLPDGLKDKSLRDPKNFSLSEWQQALRTGSDPREIKQIFQFAWKYSDSAKSLNAALSEHGFMLARGDRRGFVAVDYRGEVYALARYAGVKTKDVKARLGDPDTLPSIEEAKAGFKANITPNLKTHITQQKQNHRTQKAIIEEQALTLAQQHRRERKTLTKHQNREALLLNRHNAAQTRKNLSSLWDYLSGKTNTRKQEAQLAKWHQTKKHQQQRDNLIFQQLEARKTLTKENRRMKARQKEEKRRLHKTIGLALAMPGHKSLERLHAQERMRKALSARRGRPPPQLER